MAGKGIKPQTQEELKCEVKIPCDQKPTIQNCDIIKVEYHLKVYLDISFSFDPEVIFPVVLFPPNLAAGPQPGVAAGPYPAGAFGGPSNSDFPPPAMPPEVPVGPYPAGAFGGPSKSDFPPPAVPVEPYLAGAIGGQSNSDFPPTAMAVGPYPASPYSGSYGYPGTQGYSVPPPAYSDNPPAYAGSPGVNPVQPVHMSGGYNNPVPQVPSPYGSPFSSSSSSSVLHPPPSAPTFHPPVSAPMIHPSPSPSSFIMSPTAPTYNLVPSAPVMNTDFLSQSDEAPPEYSLIFPSSDTKKSDAK